MISNKYINIISGGLLLLILASCHGVMDKNFDNDRLMFDFGKIYVLAQRGELDQVFNILDGINDNKLTPENKLTKKRFYDRFITKEESYDYNTKDLRIIQIVDAFHSYWKSVMLNQIPIDEANSLFEQVMIDFLLKNQPKTDINHVTIRENLHQNLNAFLQKAGYYSNAFGKTGHMYDLFLWKSQEIKVYDIDLIDDSVQVPLTFMHDFISSGWIHYASFGKKRASGWATSEAIFSVAETYDTSSELFKVSLLGHEGQHFSDYTHFPALEQADLEYRAKLVELVQSQETTYGLIDKFITEGNKGDKDAHGWANYCVIRDLSNLIFKTNYVDKKNKWDTVSTSLIKEKSLVLYQQHTSQLHQLGSTTVSRLIK